MQCSQRLHREKPQSRAADTLATGPIAGSGIARATAELQYTPHGLEPSWVVNMIRKLDRMDFPTLIRIINDGARAYIGVVPADRLSDPYMSEEHLRAEIAAGVLFWGWQGDHDDDLAGVMGLQDVRDVTLVRHAYVQTNRQRQGIGEALLEQLKTLTHKPVLIGTWAAAHWAIGFYEKHGFRLVSRPEQDRLLRTYWSIPERQIDTSVVLADLRALATGVTRE